MKITLPDNLEKQIVKELSLGLSGRSRYSLDINALNVLLELTPDLAKDGQIHELVKGYLTSPARRYRTLAARILDTIGDDLGLLHLTYDCLRVHPVIGQDQTQVSGWGDTYLFDRIQNATDECIDLLIEDVREPPSYLHADLLSALPSDRIVPRMLPLLSEPLRISAQAAYVLATHGRDEGRRILEEIAEGVNLRFLELALIGLSHIPDKHAVDLIRGYTDPHHPVYAREREAFFGYMGPTELLTKSQQRLFLLEHEGKGVLVETMKRFYLVRERAEIEIPGITLPDNYTPSLFVASYYTTTHAPDFLVEFSTEADRRLLADIQKEGMSAFMSVVPEETLARRNWPRFMLWGPRPRDSRVSTTSHYLESVTVVNDEEDYLFAATDWLLNPEHYRLGSHRYYRAGLASY